MAKVGNLIFCGMVFIAGVLLSPAAVRAAHADTNAELENLRQRLERLESAERAPAPSPLWTGLGNHLVLGGLLELESFLQKIEGGGQESDLVLAAAQLNIEAEVNPRVGGHISLLYEEGTSGLAVDEAVISLTCPRPLLGGEVGLAGGRQYLPFGRYSSHFISDPLTLDLGETNNTALMLSWSRGPVTASAGVFSGEVKNGGEEAVDSWVASVEVTPLEGLTLGGSWLSDLAEAGSALVAEDVSYGRAIPAASVFVSANLGAFTLDGEYLAATRGFGGAALAGETDLTGSRPRAWNLELGFVPRDGWLLALRSEGATDFQNDPLRYGAVASCSLLPHTLVALEYLREKEDGVEGDIAHRVTAQLALEF